MDAEFHHARAAQDKLRRFVCCLGNKISLALTGHRAPRTPLVLDLLEDLTTRICLQFFTSLALVSELVLLNTPPPSLSPAIPVLKPNKKETSMT